MASIFPELGLSAAFTLISLAPMEPEWLSANTEPKTKVNVFAGLPVISNEDYDSRERIYEEKSFGGCTPSISLFNANGDRVAYSRNHMCEHKIDQNNPKDIWAEYIKGGNTEKAEYLTLSSGGADAICISSVVVTYPSSSDTYAFLPGEVAAVCQAHSKKPYAWSESSSVVQFKGPEGKVQEARPKCLWIDSPDTEGGVRASQYQGFQVHLPDFKLDNSTFKSWDQEPGQMCDALARFGMYETSNEMMCPQVFSPAPEYGSRLPMEEKTSCLPSLIPSADDGKVYSDPCEDPRMEWEEREKVADMYGKMCEDANLPYPGSIPSKQRSMRNIRPGQGTLNSPFQKRFSGLLVKSRDVGQSASGLCASRSSVGPDFYSEHERLLCKMDTKTLYPACETRDQGQVDCFDTLYNETLSGDRLKRSGGFACLLVEDWF